MFRSYLIAALRNLARNRLYAAINIVGLAVGFAAAILIALFVRDELSFDRFWPDYQRVYMISMDLRVPDMAPWRYDGAPGTLPSLLKPKLPADALIARLMEETHALRRGSFEDNEDVVWVDPDMLSILRLTPIAGDPAAAMRRPDALVLTRSAAHKYFGDAPPLNQTLELDRLHVLRVAAVVEDIPVNSHFKANVFSSGLAAFSGLTQFDEKASKGKAQGIGADIGVYLELTPRVDPALARSQLLSATREFLESIGGHDLDLRLTLLPIADIHLSAPAAGMKPRGSPGLLYAISLIGVLIVVVAGINFIILMTARSGRRAVEIGVRKAAGARFQDLALQFVGESVVYCLLAMFIALALVELLLPAFNDFLQRSISFSSLPLSRQDLAGWGLLLLLATGTGTCAGFYPAAVLAQFRAANVLKGSLNSEVGGTSVRHVLVVCQFAVLITLILATVVVYSQVRFALKQGLRLEKDQAVTIETACVGPFAAEVRRLPGVRDAACSEDLPIHAHSAGSGARASTGKVTDVFNVAVAPGFFELYGLRPVAGRFFSRERPSDNGIVALDDAFIGPVVINETAVRKLGFASPAAAVGQALMHPIGPHTTRSDTSPIIGVVPDFPSVSVREPVDALVFHTGTGLFHFLSVKLGGARIPQTLDAIDRLWARLGEPRPIARVFVDRYVQNRYADDLRQGQMFAGFALVALLIACLGLFGLSAFTAERRTKEIGIRKAMGAGQGAMVRMLLWQFTRPVLWANLVAWPVGYCIMSRWLQGFAYRIDLSWWMFVAAGSVAVSIAWLTVSAHAFAVARARPVEALRYE
ncbi:MAG: putative transport system permease protein [Gammaproteobacteria bacterium]|nr:putative transport system permease protein [Gammaproteobacteria bacterium]